MWKVLLLLRFNNLFQCCVNTITVPHFSTIIIQICLQEPKCMFVSIFILHNNVVISGSVSGSDWNPLKQRHQYSSNFCLFMIVESAVGPRQRWTLAPLEHLWGPLCVPCMTLGRKQESLTVLCFLNSQPVKYWHENNTFCSVLRDSTKAIKQSIK